MNTERELTINELDAVSGGLATPDGSGWCHHTPLNLGPGGPPANAAAMAAWNDLLREYGF
jgi:bacteriocin-like protein